ncbi:MAG: peroxiredoxin [Planctomycetota bacterium]|nr:MAG: peroxiredoxin [Planctomycetota bacterium]
MNFGRTLLSWICLTVAVGKSAMAEDAQLEVGSPAPEFTVKDDQGKDWKSSDHFGKKIVVVYFYPADLTGGCTKQACGFRDDMAKLQGAGVEVVGVSGDSVENHQLFKADRQLPFTLLADEAGEVAHKFGVPVTIETKVASVEKSDGTKISLTRKATAKRWTFVVGADGKVAYKNTMVQAAEDSQSILKAVAALKK